jgi:hypothetical protein
MSFSGDCDLTAMFDSNKVGARYYDGCQYSQRQVYEGQMLNHLQ